MASQHAVRLHVDDYVARLQTMETTNRTVRVRDGHKFYKVVFAFSWQTGRGGESVHSFVDKETGDVFMPASWRAPAKGARYNLLTSGTEFWENIDIYGYYLYKTRSDENHLYAGTSSAGRYHAVGEVSHV